ncbi:CPBP family intramembrane glutamic endopeptidase [Companilactobacillus hulinensis]|uniref:CPBP family intramembrane glutamic endopeptidase n=1 Tax=Companilactobacillus hulinensis TaxID=2486007 RepID=UPI000F7B6FEB|nr:CPBP family intramembrane glutamic endopeptidase [Companilactobacillus hulinensis]
MINTPSFYRANNDEHQTIKYILCAQIIINIVLLWSYNYLAHASIINSVLLTLLNIAVAFIEYGNQTKLLYVINVYFQAIFQLITDYLSLNYFIFITQDFINWSSPLGAIVIVLTFLLMYLPTIVIIWPKITNNVTRLLMSFLLIITLMSSFALSIDHTVVTNNSFVAMLATTEVLDAIVLFIISIIAMHSWGYKLPGYRLARNTNLWVMVGLLLFGIWFLLQNSFGSGNSIIASYFTFDFSGFNLKLKYIFAGLEAGIAEETVFRYMLLTILLTMFKRFKYNVFYSALISSLLFGSVHISNLSAGQDLPNTLIQVLSAFGLGMMFASIYLYTGLFIWPVLFHTLIDVLSFTQSGMLMSGKVGIGDVIALVIMVIIYLAISLSLLYLVYKRQRNPYSF